ncbi:MAG TPA: divalent metal cation transporter [Candidatus Paceibacterota bacterium]|nr:divalent metal cation transporter [Candidatus Paceibacterota bacterium]
MTLKKLWKSLGPGLITGIADNDLSSIATYAIAGARFGYALLWVLLFTTPFMIAIQKMCARIGALSGCGLAGNMRRHYPMWILFLMAASILIANIVNIGADLYGMAEAARLVIPLGGTLVVAGTSVVVLLLIIFLRYRQIEAVFKWLAISLGVYIIAAVAAHPDVLAVMRGLLIPALNTPGMGVVAFAVLGTTISPYLFFWQASQEAEETRLDNPAIRVCRFRPVKRGALDVISWDTRLGMTFSNLVSGFIIVLTGSVIYSSGGQNLTQLSQIAATLGHIAGPYATWLFVIGLLSAGLLAVPVLAGSAAYVVSEIMGWKASIDKPLRAAPQFYTVMIAAVALSMVIPFLGYSPLQALLLAAIINGAIAPLLLMVIVHMAKNENIVGPHQSDPTTHWLAVTAILLLLVGTVYTIIS